VNGPSPLSVSTKPAALTAVSKVERLSTEVTSPASDGRGAVVVDAAAGGSCAVVMAMLVAITVVVISIRRVSIMLMPVCVVEKKRQTTQKGETGEIVQGKNRSTLSMNCTPAHRPTSFKHI
jgi:hypothetical protein